MSHMSGRRGREARREHGRQVARLLDVVARAPVADRQHGPDLEARQEGRCLKRAFGSVSGFTARDDEGGHEREEGD